MQINSGTLHYAERLVYVVDVRNSCNFVAGRPEEQNNLEDVSVNLSGNIMYIIDHI